MIHFFKVIFWDRISQKKLHHINSAEILKIFCYFFHLKITQFERNAIIKFQSLRQPETFFYEKIYFRYFFMKKISLRHFMKKFILDFGRINIFLWLVTQNIHQNYLLAALF